ncbi:MAG: hypothetical protein MUO72_01855 [Bacteroidales bacterium]|nr:hypothetical protein [Bacteroidales bacterium]
MKTSIESSSFFNPVAFTVLIVLLAISIGLHLLGYIGVPVLVVLIIISLLIAGSIQIADQWEKGCCFTFG